jgi:hypothetical protein
MLRETTWKAAKSGSDLLTDSFSSFLSKWRKQTDHVEH